MKFARTFLFLALAGVVSPALAGNTPRAVFEAMNACVQGDAKPCRSEVTARSAPIFDRFVSYGLVRCMPKDARYMADIPEGKYVTVRGSTRALGGDRERFFRLWMLKEQGAWKLDIPQTLQAANGPNWEKQLDTAEKLYRMLEIQSGEKLGCEAVQALVKK